jgi:hypothetical protein
MTRHIISALLLTLLAPAVYAAPFSSSSSSGFGTSTSQQTSSKGMGWRDYYKARRESNWNKPIGHNFSTPYKSLATSSRQDTSFLRRNTNKVVKQPGLDRVERRDVASQAKQSPFHTTGGFGTDVQRSMPEIRDGNWEARRGKLSTPRVAKLTKTKALHRKTGGGWKVNKIKKPARFAPRPVRATKPSWRVN